MTGDRLRARSRRTAGPSSTQPEAPTRQGMEELGRRFAASSAEAVIVLTPHGLHVDDHFAVVRSRRLEGDASQWTDADTHYAGPGEPELADACVRALQDDGLPALGITFGATAAGASTMPLDWGALIPLWFMRAPAVVVSPAAPSRTTSTSAPGGARPATGERRVALDRERRPRPRPHRRRPVRLRGRSAEYDAAIQALVRENRLGELVEAGDPASRSPRRPTASGSC